MLTGNNKYPYRIEVPLDEYDIFKGMRSDGDFQGSVVLEESSGQRVVECELERDAVLVRLRASESRILSV
jgi:hypothetical protein